jgi:hypothetical protein
MHAMNLRLDWMPDPLRHGGRTLRQMYRHRTARVCARPVLVGGNQKSGTTAIAALLAKATGLGFSNDPFWYIARFDARETIVQDLLAAPRTLPEVVDRYRAYFAAGVIKDPNFSFLYPQLRERFPDSPRLFIVRDPRQNIRSILNRVRIDGRLEALGPEHQRLLEREKGWRSIFSGEGLGLDGGCHIARLAQRWNLAVERYLQQQDDVRLVRYEDFLADKAGFIHALAGQLGLDVCVDVRAEQDRQYQPRGDRSVPMETFFGKRNLALIESICADGLSRFGYA